MSSLLASRSLPRASLVPRWAAPSVSRNMATLREIELRLKSVRNIGKITKSMKMIASTQVSKSGRAMASGKEYGLANVEVFSHSPVDIPNSKKLFVVLSSDKGLCGGIHSSVSKGLRKTFAGAPDSLLPGVTVDPETPIAIVGDKSKSQLSRVLPKNIRLTVNQVGRDIPTFADAAAIADLIVKSGVEYDSVYIVYNKFISVISYEAAVMEVKAASALKESDGYKAYEMEDDVTSDLAEFALANALYATLVETHACEVNARRNAMDNASKNANDMMASLQMQYNRGRQAAITNELVDIITGASAL